MTAARTLVFLALISSCSQRETRISIDLSDLTSHFAQQSDFAITLSLLCVGQEPEELIVSPGSDSTSFTAVARSCGQATLALWLWRVNGEDRIAAGQGVAAVMLSVREVDVTFPVSPLGEVDITAPAACLATLDDGLEYSLDGDTPVRLMLPVGPHTLRCGNDLPTQFLISFGERLTVTLGTTVSNLQATLLDPVDVKLDWIGNASSYAILLGKSDDMSDRAIAGSGITSTSYVLTELADVTTYYATIEAHGSAGELLGTSNTVSFTTGDARPFVVNTTVADEYPAATLSATASVVFREPVSGATFTIDNGATANFTSTDGITWTGSISGLQTDGAYVLALDHLNTFSIAHNRQVLPFNKAFAVAPYRAFLSQKAGDDANAGTGPSTAVATLDAAITKLQLLRQADPQAPGEVRMAEGDYAVLAPLQLPARTRLIGGFADDFSGARDPVFYATQLVNTNAGSPTVLINDPSNTLGSSQLDGLLVPAADAVAVATVAIEITDGTQARIRQVHVQAGVSTVAQCYGIVAGSGAHFEILASTILAPTQPCYSSTIGIYIDGGASGLVDGSLIGGNSENNPGTAIFLGDGGARLSRNYVFSGESPNSSYGHTAIELHSPATIYNNVVYAGRGSPAVDIVVFPTGNDSIIVNNVLDADDAQYGYSAGVQFFGGPGSPLIANNVFYHRGLVPFVEGIVEGGTGLTPLVHNNVFSLDAKGVSGGVYSHAVLGQIADVATLNTIGPSYAGNFSAPTGAGVVFAMYPYSGLPTGHTVSDLPLYDFHLIDPTFFTAGLDVSTAVSGDTRDLAGNPRTAPWCIGVYQQ